MKISPVWAIRLAFMLPAIALGLWSIRVAEYMRENGLDEKQLSYLLLMAPIAIMFALITGPIISRKLGFRLMAKISTIAIITIFTLISFNPPIWLAVLCFAGFGLAAGILEIGINATAQHIDRHVRPVMSSAHGFWSIGVTLGGLIAGGLAALGFDFRAQQLILWPFLVLATVLVIANLPSARTSQAGDHAFALPRLAILPFCFIPFGALIIEGGVTEWASPFLRNERDISVPMIGIIVGVFMAGMAIIRLYGDRLRARFAPVRIIQLATLAIVVGIALFALFDNVAAILIGALIAGIGAGNIYPYTIILANAGQSDEKAAEIIGAIALVSFTAFLLAPVLMGQIGGHYSLAVGFGAIIPIAASTFIWLRLVARN